MGITTQKSHGLRNGAGTRKHVKQFRKAWGLSGGGGYVCAVLNSASDTNSIISLTRIDTQRGHPLLETTLLLWPRQSPASGPSRLRESQ